MLPVSGEGRPLLEAVVVVVEAKQVCPEGARARGGAEAWGVAMSGVWCGVGRGRFDACGRQGKAGRGRVCVDGGVGACV
eukprot:6201774-Pleurochrysis_carterae.AAC.1